MKNFVIKSLNMFGFYRHWQVRNQVTIEDIENIGISSNTLNYENALLPQFYQNLQLTNFSPEMVFDIGAHKGDWTRQALKYYPKATYHLFEPQKQLFEHYSDLEKMPNVHLHQLGIGENKGTSQFTYVERQDSCTFAIREKEAISKGYEQEMLQISSVDHFLDENDLQVPNIIKIDAEGLDLKVLKGASSCFGKTEIFLIECGVGCKVFENSMSNVIQLMHEKKYRCFEITEIIRPFGNCLWLCELAFVRQGGLVDKFDFQKT
jgi:FkbM family methyltransferase